MPAGRPRKPTDLKVLQGTLEKSRENPDEPAPVEGEPARPDWLEGVARDEWTRVSGLLREMGLLSLDVAPALEAYCRAYGDWRWAVSRLAIKRMSVLTIVRWAQMRDRSSLLMARYLTEMGLTPASRSKVRSANPGAKRTPLAEFLTRDRSG